jgi:hypothetical protein
MQSLYGLPLGLEFISFLSEQAHHSPLEQKQIKIQRHREIEKETRCAV